MHRLRLLIITLSLLVTAQTALCGGAPTLSAAQLQAVSAASASIDTMNDLESRKVIPAWLAGQQRQYYLETAQKATGRLLDQSELRRLAATAVRPAEEGLGVKAKRLLTLSNVLLVIGGIVGVAGLGAVFSVYLLPLLAMLPAAFYEVAIYLACAASIFGAGWLEASVAPYVALLGCLGLIGALAFTHSTRGRIREYDNWQLDSAILMVVWGASALYYHSPMLGFMTVLALESLLGFSVAVTPLCYSIGFTEREFIPRATFASLLLLTAYVLHNVLGGASNLPQLGVFGPGALFVGTFVYCLGMLIMASKYYDDGEHYPVMQLLNIVSGIVFLVVGNMLGLSQLSGVGGTFFCLFLAEKYAEHILMTRYWAWATTGFGFLLYGGAMFVKQHPQYFLFG